ncbi:MAG: DNA internalization-related competence protein ComEC/Rec2 [Lachnospiraceae bacterium]|nr:DNA internalization-related competence protein ComEC/Rec2 [Lachnospiraceae bacterium]
MRRPVCMIGLTFVIVILLYLYWNPYPETSFEMYEGSTVTVIGQVDKKEYRISNEQEILVIYLRNVQFLNSANNNEQNMNLMCYMESTEEPKIGSKVCIEGKFREFSHATNPGEFDARKYYQILNLHGRLQRGKVLEESREYDKFREGLYRMKQYCAGLLELTFEPKEASVMRAMLLGEKSLLDEEVETLYQQNGVIHILSISGLHISIIGMGLYKILCKLKLPRIITIGTSILFMYCYGVMTGMSVSAVRAIIMFGFHITAKLCKRTYDMLTAMTIAAISILIEQPLYLYHSGFLFSFGAILGIGLLAPVIEENWIGNPKLCKIMSTNISVSIATFPVYLNFYYEYPLYSLILNLLIIPGTSLLVTDGLLSMVGASLQIFLGKCLAIPANILLWLYEICCIVFLKLPGNRRITGQPAMWQIAIFILIICFTIICCKYTTKLQTWMCFLLAFLCLTTKTSQDLQITFLDVGQGDCIYIADEAGGHYLIDGGSSSKSDTGNYQILPFLKAEGVNRLDAVLITHMDEDHYNGIEELISQTEQSGINITKLILPDICEANKTTEYEEMVALASQEKIPVLYLHSGDVLQHGKLKLTCLHPNGCKKNGGKENGNEIVECEHKSFTTNEESLVLYLEYGAFTALFTGDLEGEGEEAVRRKVEQLDASGQGVTLLKVAHHGSKNSTSSAFLDVVSPQIAVISCGENNSYGHPHGETLERLNEVGSEILATTDYGAITVEVGGNVICLKHEKD